MKSLILALLISVLLFAGITRAAEVNLEMEFAYNGTFDKGFRFYKEDPDGSSGLIVEIGPDVRIWKGKIDIQTGRTLFWLTAYSDTEESAKSNVFPFEYIVPLTPGDTAPTIIIRFN